MTHDPWSLHSALTCPTCHVTGKVVVDESDDCDLDYSDDAPYLCVSCGQAWRDAGMVGDDSLKAARIQYGRLVEGRPYEAPPTKIEPQAPTEWIRPFEQMLRDHYSKDMFRGTKAALADLLARPEPHVDNTDTDGSFRVASVDVASGTITFELDDE